MDDETRQTSAEPVTGEPTKWSAQDHSWEYEKQGYIGGQTSAEGGRMADIEATLGDRRETTCAHECVDEVDALLSRRAEPGGK
jgi:hypothetical protein